MTNQITRFETGISENNLAHWGMLEVIKEFLQNAVYAKTILNNEVRIGWTPVGDGTGLAVISNSPSGFSKGKLLIGESEQADVAGAPGQYGEGMKAAMAVARRCGMECEVLTNGMFIKPELEPSSLDNSVKALVFYIEDVDHSRGTEFRVRCTEEQLNKAKSFFAVLDGVDAEAVKTNTILRDYEDAVYVNGVLITETPTVFAYNFTSPHLMNRDRTSINMDMVKQEVKKLLMDTTDPSVAEELLMSLISKPESLEAQTNIGYYALYSASQVDMWRKAAVKVFGRKVAMVSGTLADTQAQYKKFKLLNNVPSGWQYFFSTTLDIKPTDELDELATKPKNKHLKASASEKNNLGWAKRLVRLYYGDYGTVCISDVVVDEYGGDHYDGLYDRSTDTTWLKRSILSSKEETFKTLLHETIHRLTGALDNTSEFTAEWERACWLILTKGKGSM